MSRSLQQIWEQQDSLGLLLSGLVEAGARHPIELSFEALRPQQADEVQQLSH